MNLSFTDTAIPIAVGRSSSQATVTGNVPLPKAASRVLMAQGRASVTSAQSQDTKVISEGRITLDIICLDENKEVFSFTSSAGFKHTLDCDGAKTGMKAFVTAQIIKLDLKPQGDVLAMDAEVEMLCRVEDTGNKKMLSENGGSDVEVQLIKPTYKEKEAVGKAVSRLREEIVAANIVSVAYVAGDAVIRDIQSVIDTARVDGILSLNALCYDKDGKLFKFQQNIPFTADIQTEYDNCVNVTGKVEVSDIRLRMIGDEYGLATVDAQLDIELFSAVEKSVVLVTDAFSPSCAFDCTKRNLQLLLYKEMVEQKSVFRENITSVTDKASFKEAAYLSAKPIVTSATKSVSGVITDGIVNVCLLYYTVSGELEAVTDELPFSVTLPAEYDNIEIDAKIICTSANVMGVTENGIEVSIGLHIVADIYELVDTAIVEATTPKEPEETVKGFAVCFAAEGETPYDIAKRFNISQKSLRETNKNLQDVLHYGDKAILLV